MEQSREEELKNIVANEYFKNYDTTKIIGNIDFSVALSDQSDELLQTYFFLWAEVKRGRRHDIIDSFIQLILTIGRARTFEHYLPPKFLGAFDAEKIMIFPY